MVNISLLKLVLVILSMSFSSLISSPQISIITSIYAGDKYIVGFLKDIVQQTIFTECCELILINAHSPGNEEAEIKKYLNQYANIKYIKLTYDPGLYAVWNMAICMAQGDYITNANIDDRLEKSCYALHKIALDNHPTVDLVYSDFYVTRFPNETVAATRYHHIRCLPEFSLAAMRQPLPNNHPMWRVSMHNKYGFFNEKYRHAGDWEMWLRAVRGGAIFMKVPGILGLYYENPRGLSTDSSKITSIRAEEKEIYEEYKALFVK